MDPKKPFPKPSDPQFPLSSGADTDLNSTIEDFFSRLQSDAARPAPSAEAVSAARQAMRRLAAESVGDTSLTGPVPDSRVNCTICGHVNPPGNRYCAACGIALEAPAALSSPQDEPVGSQALPVALPEGQHHYHHHYHHHYFPAGSESGFGASRSSAPSDPVASKVRSPGGQTMSRAEAAVRKVMQDWVAACNNRQLDDLVSTYIADALVLRPNHPAVRGAAAIREFFFAALDAGFGDVELEPLRLDVVGDIAYEAGRCKMLVPVAVSKRREEKGKYLAILTRKSNGEWAIASDCWSTDLSIARPDAESATPSTLATVPPKPAAPQKP